MNIANMNTSSKMILRLQSQRKSELDFTICVYSFPIPSDMPILPYDQRMLMSVGEGGENGCFIIWFE